MKASSLSGEWASCRVTVSCAGAGVDMFVTVLRCQIALPAWLAPVDRDTWPATVCPELLSPRKNLAIGVSVFALGAVQKRPRIPQRLGRGTGAGRTQDRPR